MSDVRAPPARTEAVIVGGGVAGVTIACAFANDGLELVVLEMERDLGGVWATHANRCAHAATAWCKAGPVLGDTYASDPSLVCAATARPTARGARTSCPSTAQEKHLVREQPIAALPIAAHATISSTTCDSPLPSTTWRGV